MVLLGVMCAWMLYSVLLEYPYSTLLSAGKNIDEGKMRLSDTTNLVGKDINDYQQGGGETEEVDEEGDTYTTDAESEGVKSALWQTVDVMQIPFASYYYHYTMLPNMRGDEGTVESLNKAIKATEGGTYGYKTTLSADRENTDDSDSENALRTNVIGYIPMNLELDNDNTVLMNYPSDEQSSGRFYTTGWY